VKFNLDRHCPWHFVNGEWQTNEDGYFRPSVDRYFDDGCGPWGYRFAFCEDNAFRDFQAVFKIRYDEGFCDSGLIFGAQSSSDFYMLHFPDCAQASRAQHFWVAVSKMEEGGHLRTIKMEMVRRVASYPREKWHDIKVSMIGRELSAIIDGRGIFDAQLPADIQPGLLGLMSYAKATIQGVEIEGPPVKSSQWSAKDERKVNWFHPCPSEKDIWQQPISMVRDVSGELLLLYREVTLIDNDYGPADWFIVRSTDNGNTWGDPRSVTQVLPIEDGESRKAPSTFLYLYLHRFPDGALKIVSWHQGVLNSCESVDAGRTWNPKIDTHTFGSAPEGLGPHSWGPQPFVNLSDGSVLLMLYGTHDSTPDVTDIYTWGGVHCHAYRCRSADGRKSWSSLIAVDNVGDDAKTGQPLACNLDLTEVCASEVDDGKVMALVRPIYSPWMWETWSEDGGRTWGPCMRGPFPGYATPNMLRTSSGAVLVAHRLPGLTVHCSLDGGMSWDHGTMIDNALWAMGSMVEVEPDLVLYLYWDSCYSLMRGQYLRIVDGQLAPQLCQQVCSL